MNVKPWISAFRLRTLPLALSSIVVGNAIVFQSPSWSYLVFGLTVLTTILLQILSNLANDYGDGIKGTDNEARVGPERAVQSGAISLKGMKYAVIIFAMLSLASGLSLLFVALDVNIQLLLWLLVGIIAIAAAIMYTVGKNAYGYLGLGDLFVFLFFGLVGVLGSCYLQTEQFNWAFTLPAAAIGLLSAGVLNLNNMRDHKNDFDSGKYTLVTKMGYQNARIYHALITLTPILALIVFEITYGKTWEWSLLLLPLAIIVIRLKRILSVKNERELDPELKFLALTTFLTALLFALGINL